MEIIRNETFNCELQIIKIEDQLWFKGKAICDVLGYNDTNQAIRTNVDEKYKKRLSDINPVDLTGMKGNAKNQIFISEPGLYELLFSSKLPQAKKFRGWVIEDVLPSLRKTGKYQMEENENDEIDILDNMFTKINELKITHNQKRTLINYLERMYFSKDLSEACFKINDIQNKIQQIESWPSSVLLKEKLQNNLFERLLVNKVEEYEVKRITPDDYIQPYD